MKKIMISVVVLLLLSAGHAQGWQLVYHNDADGNRVAGDISQLIQAVYDGKDVRIAWWSTKNEDGVSRVHHVADAAFLTVMMDSVVMAQIRPITGQKPDFSKFNIILREQQEWVAIFGTNGFSDTMMRNTAMGDIASHKQRQQACQWFIREDQ